MKPIIILSFYNLISFTLITGILILCRKVIRKESTKDIVLKSVSIAVVLIHLSSMYVDFFTNNGEAVIEDNILLPIYPCNIIMWLLVVVAFMKNKTSKLFNTLAQFTFLVGTVAGVVGVLINFNFLNNPTLADYDILKGLLSHWFMIFGTIYLFVFKYIKLDVVNTTKSVFWGLVLFASIGAIINTLFFAFDIPSVNAMYMLYPPIPELPFINFYTIGILGILITFLGLNIYELFTLKKGDRWINRVVLERSR